MVRFEQRDPSNVLDETATLIGKLALDLENREIEGESISRAEIRKIASQLQAHVRDLLAISNNLQAVKSKVASEYSAIEN
jgi:hypothetical protein